MMEALSKIEVKDLLSDKLKHWSFDGYYLKRDFEFKTFVEAFSFMTAVAMEAEKIAHHPDWSNVYNKVAIKLNTDDAKGITRLDFDLAVIIDRVFEKFK